MTRIVFSILGIIASIVIIAAVFMPWLTVHVGDEPWRRHVGDASGWEITQGDIYFQREGLTQERNPLPLVAFVGGIIGGIFCLGCLLLASRPLAIPVLFGGLAALAGGIWAFGDIFEAHYHIFDGVNEYMTVGQGAYVCMGAGLALLFVGAILLNVMKKPSVKKSQPYRI